MVFFNPVFNQNSLRPNRWALQSVDSGDIIDRYWLSEDHFTHWTDKTAEGGAYRDVFTTMAFHPFANFAAMRRKTIGFLTTYHRDMYEDGKYTEVYNDPLNYIYDDPTDYTDAYPDAEQRIGNYRMGARRHITHLGGTISEDELDMFKDIDDVALTSFPLMPPAPTDAAFTKPFRTKLTTTDVGYIDYIKAAHSSETTTARYAHRAEQGTGFRRFVYDAGNTNMMYESLPADLTPVVSQVKIADLESIIDAKLVTAITGTTITEQFLPDDGEDVLINFPGKNIMRSDTDGVHFEIYNNTSLQTLVSLIDIDATTGDVYLGAGTTDITIAKDGAITLDDGTRSIVLGATNIVMTNGSRSITISSSVVTVA